MNKKRFSLMALLIFFLLALHITGKEKKKILIEKSKLGVTQTISSENSQTKRQQYVQLKNHLLKLAGQSSKYLKKSLAKKSIEGINGLNSPNQNGLQEIESSVHIQPDDKGYVYMTGLCENVNVPQAVLIFVSVDFFDSVGSSLGTSLGMAFGNQNVQIPGDEGVVCLGAIEQGEEGIFLVWSENVLYSQAHSYLASFYYGTGENGPLPYANTQLSIEGDLQCQSGSQTKLHVTANAKNSCSNYVSFYTMVMLAVFDSTNTKVIDINANYIGDTSSPGYNFAIYPLQSKSFNVFFNFAPQNGIGDQYRYTFLNFETEANISGDQHSPLGTIDLPVDNATVNGSIAVTGWALDNVGIESVKIYRQGNNELIYLGDANFLEGARDDIAAQYPTYPNNSKAGWGYMLLTNFLPNGGNGTFTLCAIASDYANQSTVLGTKTIICDNANAVKPFGAIDTPTQGGPAFGNNFTNWGWVLTPLPDHMDTDGSTIMVYVDGVGLGHPYYNIYREDIATLFPGYANSNGAIGYFPLDTTTYEDGVHMIYWVATDSGLDTDGIGSRYFNIMNGDDTFGGTVLNTNSNLSPIKSMSIAELPINNRESVQIKKGFKKDIAYIEKRCGNHQPFIELKELELIEILLSQNSEIIDGYHRITNHLYPLPIGSTLDKKRRKFYWIPGPGFLGNYQLVFIERDKENKKSQKIIQIKIVPGQKKYFK